MNPNEWKERMAKYEQELLQMRKSSRLSPEQAAPPPAVPSPTTEHFQGNISQEENSGQYLKRPITPRTAPLRIRVVSNVDDQPVSGVLVGVDKRTPRGREPLYVRLNDADGYIESLLLPVGEADTVFDIWTSAVGFYREIRNGILSRGEPLEITVRLTPLPEL